MKLRRLMSRDPMVLFILLGGCIYLAYGMFTTGETSQQINLSNTQVDEIITDRELALGRTLSNEERDDVLSHFIDREILVREAIARGLYQKDSKVYKRLADQMYFLIEEEPPEPTAVQLQAQFDANPDAYLTPRATTFEHVYFKSDKEQAVQALEEIRAGKDADELGDTFWLGGRMERYSTQQLLVLMGFDFDRALRKLPVGEWRGPIRSGRGWHVVKVIQRHEPALLHDVELKRRLIADWKSAWRETRREQRLADLRNAYTVVYGENDG